MKLSIMQKKVIIILAGLLIAALSFFLIFQKNLEKTEEVNREISKHKSQVSYLQNLEPKVREMSEKAPQWETETSGIVNSFPCYLAQEDIIYQLYQFQQETKVPILNVSPQGEMKVFSAGTASHPFIAIDGATAIEVGEGTALNPVEMNPTAPVALGKMEGYMNPYQITFDTVTEDVLKNAIDWIAAHQDKIAISNIAVAAGDGGVSGSMTLNFFSLRGNGRSYEPLNHSGVKTGILNIFHTTK